eukprot:768138-Hanusia_phi.AAC.2
MPLKAVMSSPTEEKVNLGLAKIWAEDVDQSKTYNKEREGFFFGDVFADGVIRNGGFSEFAETVNGRVAQLAFPLAVGETFNGDLLSQIADHPIKVLLLCALVTYASLPPLFEARTDDRRGASVFKAAVPPEVRKGLVSVFETFELNKIFSPEAELTNSRAAMIAMGFYLFTAAIF